MKTVNIYANVFQEGNRFLLCDFDCYCESKKQNHFRMMKNNLAFFGGEKKYILNRPIEMHFSLTSYCHTCLSANKLKDWLPF